MNYESPSRINDGMDIIFSIINKIIVEKNHTAIVGEFTGKQLKLKNLQI